MPSVRRLRGFVLVVSMMLAGARAAGAADAKKDEARRLYDEATAAFGVGDYAAAAENYEASFKLHPDAALLYNAAQAYRMAGNHGRALQLYRNFLRIYADNPRAEDARHHVAALEKAIADGSKPAATAAPGPGESAAPESAPLPAPLPAPSLNGPAPQSQQPSALIGQQASPPANTGEEERPLVTRPWFWVVVGAVVVGGAAAIALGMRKDAYPDPTLGRLH